MSHHKHLASFSTIHEHTKELKTIFYNIEGHAILIGGKKEKILCYTGHKMHFFQRFLNAQAAADFYFD